MAENNIILTKERDTEISCNTAELIRNSTIKKHSKELIEPNFAWQHSWLFCFILVYYFLQRESVAFLPLLDSLAGHWSHLLRFYELHSKPQQMAKFSDQQSLNQWLQ